jgi:ApbE superfamily uncharacterized protein (UPF0280 family)
MDAAGLVGFEVVYGETDLHIAATRDLSAEAEGVVRRLRRELEEYIVAHPHYLESYVPVDVEPDAAEIVRVMADAARAAGVGPMAAVAGAFAEGVARELALLSREVIVENGGDLFIIGPSPRTVLLLAGSSPLSGKVAITLPAGAAPVAICTASGKVGHSVSHGSAHAVTVVAANAALADAVATSAGNLVHGPEDIELALDHALAVPGVRGAVVVAGNRLGARGEIELAAAAGDDSGATRP